MIIIIDIKCYFFIGEAMEYESTFVMGDMLEHEERFAEKYAASAEQRLFQPGHVFARQGEGSDRLYLVTGGIVECGYMSEQGRKKLITIHAGRCLIGAPEMSDDPCPVNYTALTSVRAAVVPAARMSSWDDLMLLSFAKLQKRNERFLSRQLLMRTFSSTEERILCVLRDFDEVSRHMPRDFCWPACLITNKTLSEFTGATTVQVRKIMNAFLESGRATIDENKNYRIVGEGECGGER